MDFVKKAFLALILSAFTLNLVAQEYLIGLSERPKQNASTTSQAKSSRSGEPYLTVPFFEDFAKPGNSPNPDLWISGPVDVNLTYGKNPYSIGVATLDMLDENGKLHSNATVAPFMADSLTSHFINLNYPGNNSIFLSFQYEPAGYGDMPEVEDSLILRLYSSVEKKWIVGWSTRVEKGVIKEYNHLTAESKEISGGIDTTFHNVILQINQPEFLTDSFRIQFYNKGSLNNNSFVPGLKANADQWNLDMIYLDRDRNPEDTALYDVGISKPLKSMLLEYEAIPWKHFTPNVRSILTPNPSSITLSYHNQTSVDNPSPIWNVTQFFQITNILTESKYLFTGSNENILPNSTYNFEILYNYNYTSPAEDSAIFSLKTYLSTIVAKTRQSGIDQNLPTVHWNDTISRAQLFKNYYAYDDGSAENGYGLFGEGTDGAMVAMKFNCLVKDTLRGIYTYFNLTHSNPPLYNSTESLRFYLTVWKDNNGKPGQVVYRQEGVKPKYSSELNEFVYYKLITPVELEGTFFVGWEQVSQDMLNVGFDRNNINNEKLFYNLNGGWIMSGLQGTLMLRPVFGKDNGPTTNVPTEPAFVSTKLYPNPASNTITIERDSQQDSGYAQLFDLTGRSLMNLNFNEQIDVSGLPSGMYLVKITNRLGKTETKKLIISR